MATESQDATPRRDDDRAAPDATPGWRAEVRHDTGETAGPSPPSPQHAVHHHDDTDDDDDDEATAKRHGWASWAAVCSGKWSCCPGLGWPAPRSWMSRIHAAWARRQLDAGFDPGSGYERVPFSSETVSDLYEGESEPATPQPTPPAVGGMGAPPTQAGMGGSFPGIGSAANSAKSSRRTRNSEAARTAPLSVRADPISAYVSDAEKLDRLSELACLRVTLDTGSSNGSGTTLSIVGPIRYTYDVRRHKGASSRLPRAALDDAGCPLTPIAAMDAAEDLITRMLATSAEADVPPVVALRVMDVALIESPHPVLSREEVGFSADDARESDVQPRRMPARGRSTGTVDEMLDIVAQEFESDYSPDEIRTRVALFVNSVIRAVSRSLQHVTLRGCVFSAHDIGTLFKLPCAAAADHPARGLHMFRGGLTSVVFDQCGLGDAHLLSMLREASRMRRATGGKELHFLSTVERFALGGSFTAGALQQFLGFVHDGLPEATTIFDDLDGINGEVGADVAADPRRGRYSYGLRDLEVPASLKQLVVRHRIYSNLRRLNGAATASELLQ